MVKKYLNVWFFSHGIAFYNIVLVLNSMSKVLIFDIMNQDFTDETVEKDLNLLLLGIVIWKNAHILFKKFNNWFLEFIWHFVIVFLPTELPFCFPFLHLNSVHCLSSLQITSPPTAAWTRYTHSPPLIWIAFMLGSSWLSPLLVFSLFHVYQLHLLH